MKWGNNSYLLYKSRRLEVKLWSYESCQRLVFSVNMYIRYLLFTFAGTIATASASAAQACSSLKADFPSLVFSSNETRYNEDNTGISTSAPNLESCLRMLMMR